MTGNYNKLLQNMKWFKLNLYYKVYWELPDTHSNKNKNMRRRRLLMMKMSTF